MPGWVHQVQTLLGAAALCVGMAGCAAQHDDALRLSEELGRARADAAWQQARAAELEARLSRLEQKVAVPQNALSADDRALMRHVDRLLDMNERLLAERVALNAPAPVANAPAPVPALAPVAAPASTPAPTAAPPPKATTSTTAAAGPMLSDEQQLRALVERLRGHPGSPHGGLTREQENALRVLTRPERALDSENPWSAAIY